MITRPTTEQVLLECARELMDGVLPHLQDDTAVLRVVMLEQVLRNAAVRSAHEIAWMRTETTDAHAYATAVGAATGAAAVVAALDELDREPRDGLDLEDVVRAYGLASVAFSVALEAALSGGPADLRARGEQLLQERLAREQQVLAGWSPAGR